MPPFRPFRLKGDEGAPRRCHPLPNNALTVDHPPAIRNSPAKTRRMPRKRSASVWTGLKNFGKRAANAAERVKTTMLVAE